MLIFTNNTKQRKGVLPKEQFRNWGYLLTIYTGIPGKEVVDTHRFVKKLAGVFIIIVVVAIYKYIFRCYCYPFSFLSRIVFNVYS